MSIRPTPRFDSSEDSDRDPHRLAILPLSDEVHFPQTDLCLHVVLPEYCELLRERFYAAPFSARVGTVLLRPESVSLGEQAAVYHAGTAARLVDLRDTAEGCEIVLRGEFRFEVEREIEGGPCREALVRPIREAELSEHDPDVQSLRSELFDRVACLSLELGDRFELDDDQLRDLRGGLPFEALVNHLAANLEVAPERKLQLLRDELPERAAGLLTILRCRQQVLDILRPYRHLAATAEVN
ncbi:MAG: LON peptidase substrate-binding domain-containing protein [Acidobacteriota bacterium]